MSTTDELLRNAEAYAASFDKGALPLPPGRKIAVLACMDARLNPYGLLGLQEGDAHVIRNAGGVVTDDEIRSLAISQRLLGTEEIILIHHTDCGMLTFTDDEFKRSVQDDVGIKPTWSAEAFRDLDEDVRQSIARIKASPFIPRKDSVRGFIYDVHKGALAEVAGDVGGPSAGNGSGNGRSAYRRSEVRARRAGDVLNRLTTGRARPVVERRGLRERPSRAAPRSRGHVACNPRPRAPARADRRSTVRAARSAPTARATRSPRRGRRLDEGMPANCSSAR
jgi:carbonic anhydrase